MGRCFSIKAAGLAHSLVFKATNAQHFIAPNQSEIDASAIQIHTADLHLHPRANGISDTGAFAAQLLTRFVKAVVLATKFGDVHQAFHVHRIQGDKNTKRCGGSDHARKLLAQVFAHVLALEPSLYISAGFVRSALIGAAMQTRCLPRQQFSAHFFRCIA